MNLDKFTGLYPLSNGGTENMYRSLMKYLSETDINNFQIICSRVRELIPNKKQILWLHDLATDPENDHLKNTQLKRRFSKLVFVSNWQFNTYNIINNIQYNESVVIKNAIEPFPLNGNKKSFEKIKLIYHTTPHRGLNILIPVFLELCKYHKDIHLDVFSSFDAYGWKERDEPYKELFKICNEHPNIKYHGFKPNEIIREYLEQSHIFAFPSIWQETSCIAAIEAMAAGNLVVCSNLAALSETVGENGLTYQFNEDINQHANIFFNKLNQGINFVKNQNDFINFSNNLMININNHYNWKNRINQWNELLNGINTE